MFSLQSEQTGYLDMGHGVNTVMNLKNLNFWISRLTGLT